MKLPNYRDVVVSGNKIAGYLLSLSHPVGRSKAQFFLGFGFRPDKGDVLIQALKAHAAHEVSRTEPSPFGMRYIIDGALNTPDGRDPLVRTVWFIETDKDLANFVTAYPFQN